MAEIKALIELNDKKDKQIINDVLKESFESFELFFDGLVGELEISDADSFELTISEVVNHELSELGISVKFLEIPYFDKMFVKYLKKSSVGYNSIFDLFVRSKTDKRIKLDCKKIYNSFEKKDIDTLKAYLACNCNSSLTADKLYLHRNSFSYRMSLATIKKGIDLRNYKTLMFFSYVFSIINCF